jgi:ubiquinone/menaquinone biosynthesis C-methylase UbiE
VVSNFGVQHFPDPARVLAEVRRVLKVSGRFAFTVWEAPGHSVLQGLVKAAATAHGSPVPAAPEAPPEYALSDPAEVRRVLETAGFTEVRSRVLELIFRARDAREIVEIFRTGTVRLGAQLRDQTPEALERITAALDQSLAPWRTGTGVEVPIQAVMSSGGKP